MNRPRQSNVMGLPRSVLQYFPAQQLLRMLMKQGSNHDNEETDQSPHASLLQIDSLHRLSPALQEVRLRRNEDRKPSYSTMEVRHPDYSESSQSKYDEMMAKHRRKLERQKQILLRNIQRTDQRMEESLLKSRRSQTNSYQQLENKTMELDSYFAERREKKQAEGKASSRHLVVVNSTPGMPEVVAAKLPLIHPAPMPSLQNRRTIYSMKHLSLEPIPHNELSVVLEEYSIEPWK